MAIPEGTDLMEDLEDIWHGLCREWAGTKIASHKIVMDEMVSRLVIKWNSNPAEVRPIVERFYNEAHGVGGSKP